MNNLTNQEFDLLLQKTYPNLYIDMHGDPTKTCMAWGACVPKAWRNILFDGSAELEMIILSVPEADRKKFKALQVKEKFGSFRFYFSAMHPSEFADQMHIAVHKMEDEIAKLPKKKNR